MDTHSTPHPLPLPSAELRDDAGMAAAPEPAASTTAPGDLQPVMDIPVRMRAILGRARMDLNQLLRLKAGEVVELDRRAGEPVDIFVNNRFIARGEVVLIDNDLGVTLTEIVRQDR
ncbi:flagellar motor switch protein FliN [Sphingomonas sp. AP4-R1]|nr:flagellar motor switch protein FliN [Sphingomonas sp. AP4-R1]